VVIGTYLPSHRLHIRNVHARLAAGPHYGSTVAILPHQALAQGFLLFVRLSRDSAPVLHAHIAIFSQLSPWFFRQSPAQLEYTIQSHHEEPCTCFLCYGIQHHPHRGKLVLIGCIMKRIDNGHSSIKQSPANSTTTRTSSPSD
jgi:hypothetical protein